MPERKFRHAKLVLHTRHDLCSHTEISRYEREERVTKKRLNKKANCEEDGGKRRKRRSVQSEL